MEQGLWSISPVYSKPKCRAGRKRSSAMKMAAAGAACQRGVELP